jgi:hypothetical protein
MAIAGIVDVFMPKPFVGKIYGKKIPYETFDNQLRENIHFHLMNNEDADLDEQTLRNLNDQTWNQLVSRNVMDRQLRRYRIRVRERDVIEKFRNDPPRELMQNPSFLTNGAWDQQKYLEIIANNPEFAHSLEEYIRQLLPYELLERRIKDQVIVTTDSVRVDWLSRNDRVSGRVILFDWNTIAEQNVTDEDVRAFYNRNRSNYRVEPSRRFRYVTLRLEPSAADSSRALEDINYIYSLIRAGGDFGALAEHYSTCPSSANQGSLDFFGRGQMVPEFDTVAFDMPVGGISEPFSTQFGWHIIHKTGERVNEHGAPEVGASHILIRIETSDRTRMDLRSIADNLFDRANRIGLERAATEMGLETVETPDFFSDAEHIPGIGRFPNLVTEAFSKRVGFLPEPIRLQDGSNVIAELSYRRGAHTQDLEQVSEVIRREIDRERRMALSRERAVTFLNEYNDFEFFDKVAEYGLRVLDFNDITVTRNISGIGIDRQLNRALFNLNDDEWSQVITTDRNSYIAFVSNRNRPDMETFYNDLPRLTQQLRQSRENSHYSEWYQRVLKEANVVDLRYMFYQ